MRDAIFGALFAGGPATLSARSARPTAIATRCSIDAVRAFATRAFRAAERDARRHRRRSTPAIARRAVDGPRRRTGRCGSAANRRRRAAGAAPRPVNAAVRRARLRLRAGPGRRSPTSARRPRWISSPTICSVPTPASCANASREPSERIVVGQFVTYHDPGVMFVMTRRAAAIERRAHGASTRRSPRCARPLDAGGVRARARRVRLPHPQRSADAAELADNLRLVRGRRQRRHTPPARAATRGRYFGGGARADAATSSRDVARQVSRAVRAP